MRNIILCLLVAFATQAIGQISISDSIWIKNETGTFFEYKKTDYMSGESIVAKKKLGDTLQLLNNYKQDILNTTSNWSTDVQWTSNISRKVTELIRYDATLVSIIDTSPIKAIVRDNEWMVDSTFRIKDKSGPVKNLRFTITAAGVLRYKIDTFTTRTAVMLGNIIRLNNYLNTGSSLDLFQFPDKRWRDLTRAVQLYTPDVGAGSVATREAPPASDTGAPMAALDGGILAVSGKYYKWNATKKKWLPVPAPTSPTPVKL